MRGRTGTIRRIEAQHRLDKLTRLLHMAFGDPPDTRQAAEAAPIIYLYL